MVVHAFGGGTHFAWRRVTDFPVPVAFVGGERLSLVAETISGGMLRVAACLTPSRQRASGPRHAYPRTQDLFVAAVSRMFSIGTDLGYTDRNPATRIERLYNPESYEPWPLSARERFEASDMSDWMRDVYMLALWTRQRESDVLRLPRSRFDGNGFHIRQGRPEAKRGKGRRGPVGDALYRRAAARLSKPPQVDRAHVRRRWRRQADPAG